MHLILMNQDNSFYAGAICVTDLEPWYVTGLTGPTLFPTEEGAMRVVKKLQKARPKDEFTVLPTELYLSIISPSLNNEWLSQMREEFGESQK